MRTRTLVVALALASTSAGAQQVDYNRAEQFLNWNTSRLISGNQVNPQWMEDDNQFWYRGKTANGYEFRIVDPVRNIQGALFDHYRLAASMSMVADTAFNPDKLPFSTFEFLRDETAIEFTANQRKFDCDIGTYVCTAEPDTTRGREDEGQGRGGGGFGRFGGNATPFVESPDEKWEVFAKEYNLFIRPKGGGDTVQLTTDGEKYWAYGFNEPRPNQQRQGGRALRNRRPNVRWSPDSRRLIVSRQDQRGVEHMHYISYTPQRPQHFSQPYALPGDSIIPYPGFHIITINTDIISDGADGSGGDGGADRVVVQQAGNIAPMVEPNMVTAFSI